MVSYIVLTLPLNLLTTYSKVRTSLGKKNYVSLPFTFFRIEVPIPCFTDFIYMTHEKSRFINFDLLMLQYHFCHILNPDDKHLPYFKKVLNFYHNVY